MHTDLKSTHDILYQLIMCTVGLCQKLLQRFLHAKLISDTYKKSGNFL